jgi:preprotein translocase subunit SecE
LGGIRIVAKPSVKKGESAEPTIAVVETLAPDKKPLKKQKKIDASDVKPKRTPKKNVFRRMGAYFKGAWVELRQVRWPDRKATWGMTGALLAFTLFFVVVILVLDYGFSQLFKLILGSN